jgi:hypothetical protein
MSGVLIFEQQSSKKEKSKHKKNTRSLGHRRPGEYGGHGQFVFSSLVLVMVGSIS